MDRQPTDVWQPEGFVFPSMLTNGLFMVSLCLIVGTMIAVLAAQKSNKSILIGAGAMLVLMNVHSYDVLVVLFALIGLLAMSAVRRQLTWPWVGRAVLIGLGAVPSALWFVHVLQLDPVFQSRAATETYSPNFRAVLFGYLPMIAIGFVALVARPSAKGPEKVRRYAGAAIVAAVFLAMAVFAAGHTTDSYFMGLNAWVAAFVSLLIGLALLADENPTWNLIASWAVLGTIAIYFPGLFQRKLAMGLAIPWGILAAIGLVQVTKNQERNPRNLLAALVLILFSASSFRWLAREFVYLRTETSNTTIHPVYLTADVSKIMAYLNKLPGKKVVAAPPGYATPQTGPDGQAAPDEFLKPLVPDLNPIASGLTGSYTFAGHWSETPDYDSRRNQLAQLFFGNESPSDRLDIIHSIGVNYLIAPVPEAFPQLQPFDFSSLGKVVVDGNQFRLIQVR
jgi:arabinosyltransferase C